MTDVKQELVAQFLEAVEGGDDLGDNVTAILQTAILAVWSVLALLAIVLIVAVA